MIVFAILPKETRPPSAQPMPEHRGEVHSREKEVPPMWSSCHPKSDEDMKECAELGKSLNRH